MSDRQLKNIFQITNDSYTYVNCHLKFLMLFFYYFFKEDLVREYLLASFTGEKQKSKFCGFKQSPTNSNAIVSKQHQKMGV